MVIGEASASLTDRVRAALLEALPAGESSMQEVASRLGLSKRTLQRRLRDEGTSFKAVVQQTRERSKSAKVKDTYVSSLKQSPKVSSLGTSRSFKWNRLS